MYVTVSGIFIVKKKKKKKVGFEYTIIGSLVIEQLNFCKCVCLALSSSLIFFRVEAKTRINSVLVATTLILFAYDFGR